MKSSKAYSLNNAMKGAYLVTGASKGLGRVELSKKLLPYCIGKMGANGDMLDVRNL